MIKDVLVHLNGTPHDEERLKYAEAIATASQAHITGLFTNMLPDLATLVPMDGAAAAAEIAVSLEEDAKRTGNALQEKMTERFARLAGPSEIRRVDATPGELPRRAVSEARWADIAIFGRPYDREDDMLWDDVFEAVLFEAGRSVLVVPPGKQAPDVIRRILVCWRDTRESARAVAEASPLIAKATRTEILLVDPKARDNNGNADGADIARHLDRLGTVVEVNIVESKGRDVSEIILEQARRMSADLVVMGGYGHSRAREWMIGGATRDMLTTSEFPILMAH